MKDARRGKYARGLAPDLIRQRRLAAVALFRHAPNEKKPPRLAPGGFLKRSWLIG
jgi:hypothetical protein